MRETLITRCSRWILACTALLGASALSVDAWAQMNPAAPPPQGAPVNPMCPRLEAQLATIDRGGGSGDPAKDEQVRRYQDAASKQQGDLDRALAEFSILLERNPDYTAGYFMAAQTLARAQRVEDAKKMLTDGIASARRTGNLHAQSEMEAMLTELG